MENRIIKFISALRASGVRVSMAESADAFKAIESLGIKDREVFRLSLQSTLVKDVQNLGIFEELFPLFFESSQPPPLMDPSQDLTEEEAQMLAEALRQLSQKLRDLLEKMLQGEPFNQEELEKLAEMTGLDHADDMRFREWMARRMERALNFPEVRAAMEELLALLSEMGMDPERLEQLRQMILSNQLGLEDQLRRFAGQRIAEQLSERPPEEGVEGLLDRPFESLSQEDLQRMRQEVGRLAALLRTRVALRQKRAKSGQLDAKATIRANLRHGNVPFEIHHRDHYLKPKLVVLCDVSTSMRPVSEFMLSLLYALQDQISKTHAFAFIDHLEFISPDLTHQPASEAVTSVLDRMPPGHYNTDLGFSLQGFCRDFLDKIDSRTSFIMVGDGRNNYNDPRLDLFQRLARRSNRTIWITPEPPALWGTGDSDMHSYVPYCDIILQVRNMRELTAAIDRLLT